MYPWLSTTRYALITALCLRDTPEPSIPHGFPSKQRALRLWLDAESEIRLAEAIAYRLEQPDKLSEPV
jgi:hypothetical protein